MKNRPFKEQVREEQYNNAKKHWTKLINREISGEFDMAHITEQGTGCEYIENESNICGTAACSLGYLPETLNLNYSDIKKYIIKDCEILDFDVICKDYIGISQEEKFGEWTWCFSGMWENYDNSSKGAGIRMKILYEQGLPKNWMRQLLRKDPLMYKKELMEIKELKLQ